MNSVDKTQNMSLLNEDSENQQVTSLNYTVTTPRLSQNERKMDFGMLVAGTSVNALQVCFVALVPHETVQLGRKHFSCTLAGTT